MSAPSGHSGSGAIIAALGANLGIAVLKFLAFALTRSSSMLAEAIHSVADSGNQVFLLVGGRTSPKQADEEPLYVRVYCVDYYLCPGWLVRSV